ncbi:MAG: AAA family ATPase [Muribaculaceae bacterium]|nr:AAA family ATPase [Muribaculaceae bacterium]
MDIQELYANSYRLVSQVSTKTKRYLYHQLPWDVRMLCIRGSRGVGKTTLLLQRMAEVFPAGSNQALYVSLDELWFNENRLVDLAEYHYAHGGTHLFLDEVHRYPHDNWAQEIKNIYDRYPGFHVVFTGSSVLKIDQSQADLSRRCLFFTMQGLSFREYLEFSGIARFDPVELERVLTSHVTLAMEITRQVHVLQYFGDYLRHGYYPFYLELAEGYEMALRQMVANVIEQDIPQAESVEMNTINRMKRLIALIARVSPFTVNVSRIANTLECDRQTVYKLLRTMHRASLINLLYKGKNNMQQLVKPEKVYLENTNLMLALASEINTGNLRETFFANQLFNAHELAFSGSGDFLIDNVHTIEVGGHRKSFEQIKDLTDSYLAVDDIEIGNGNRIPLWLFGFLY